LLVSAIGGFEGDSAELEKQEAIRAKAAEVRTEHREMLLGRIQNRKNCLTFFSLEEAKLDRRTCCCMLFGAAMQPERFFFVRLQSNCCH